MMVTVPAVDFLLAGTVGMRRAVACLHKKMERNGGNSHAHDPVFDQAIYGAVAEFIVAGLLNLFWEPKVGELSKGDVGGYVEVRCRNPASGDEIGIHDTELNDTPFVCVVYRGGFNFEIAGWVYGSDAQERGEWNDKRQCFFVPRPYRPMSELRAWVEEHRLAHSLSVVVSRETGAS